MSSQIEAPEATTETAAPVAPPPPPATRTKDADLPWLNLDGSPKPVPGSFRSGYRFISGDPTKKTSWQKARFFRVEMHPKRDEQDTEAVEVAVNGDTPRLLRKGSTVIITESERDILDHAVHPTFRTRITGNKHVMVQAGEVRRDGYTLLGEATWQEYLSEKAKSNKTRDTELNQLARVAAMNAQVNGDE